MTNFIPLVNIDFRSHPSNPHYSKIPPLVIIVFEFPHQFHLNPLILIIFILPLRARLGARGRLGFCWFLRPLVLGITSTKIGANVSPGAFPEARQVPRDLDRTVRGRDRGSNHIQCLDQGDATREQLGQLRVQFGLVLQFEFGARRNRRPFGEFPRLERDKAFAPELIIELATVASLTNAERSPACGLGRDVDETRWSALNGGHDEKSSEAGGSTQNIRRKEYRRRVLRVATARAVT